MSRLVLYALLLLNSGVDTAVRPATLPAIPRRAVRAADPVYLSSCAVMFGVRSSGASETRAGLFGGPAANEKRTDVKIQRIYILTGYDSTAFQRITDTLCGDAPGALAAAGYQVLTDSAQRHFIWADREGIGQRSPQEQKMGDTRYLVYAHTGASILDPMIVGGMNSPKLRGWDATIGKQYGLRAINVLYTVDFATIEAATGLRLLGLNRAEVSAKLNVTVGATVTATDASDAKCTRMAPFGKHKNREFCLFKTGMAETYQTADDEEKPYRDPILSVTESTTSGQQLAGAVSELANVLSARGGRRVDIEQFDVAVEMTTYERRVLEGSRGVLATAMAAIENPALRKGRKK